MNPVPVVLSGDVVRLEPLDNRHADELLEAAGDPAIWLYLPMPQPSSVADVRGWIEDTVKQASTGDQLPFAIVDAASDRAIGSTRYLEIRSEWRTLEIGWTWLALVQSGKECSGSRGSTMTGTCEIRCITASSIANGPR